MIGYEFSRGFKIDGTKPSQTGNTFGEKKLGKGRQEETDKKVASKGHRCQERTQKIQTEARKP